ncbi:MAG TPA: hypothetical protein VIP77_04750 [Jiangellaceae bacterium]
MTIHNRRRTAVDRPSDTFFTIWAAVCGLVAIGALALTAWAVITVVQWLVTK